MSDQPAPLPRIGDAERDRAAELLRDHLAEGRLDQGEFDDRVTRALTARTQADLDPLFTDLPGPRPGGSSLAPAFQAPPWQQPPAPLEYVSSPAPVPAKSGHPWGISSTAAWIIVIIAVSAFNAWDNWWWLVFIPIFLSGGWGHQRRGGRSQG
ncbi:MAG TPA: DUF1707 domain-containing protein [Propionibacteriaceae bacterium]|nr:DUF1707 domain-containing protein [Propionibacteriaceae bacterium]